ncbi:hypothetical protein ACFLZ7_01200 [Nanoarchaeota archaeon]
MVKEINKIKNAFNIKTAHIVLYDILCLVGFFLIITAWGNLIQNLFADFDFAVLSAAQPEQLAGYASQIQTIAFGLIGYTLLMIILQIANYSFFQGKIWNHIFNSNLTKRYFWKFSLLNLIWIVAATLVSILIYLLFNQTPMLAAVMYIILTIIIVCLLVINYIQFTQKNLVFKSIKNTFLMLNKINKFIKQIGVTAVVFILLSFVSMIFNLLPQAVSMVVVSFLLLIYAAWARLYLAEALKSVKV